MAKEWIDVADTAVKIGLGSLITGIFTYIGIKFSHSSDKNKFMLEHKTKLLEEIANDAEKYFIAWNGVVSKVGGITKLLPHDQEVIQFTKKQLDAIKEKDAYLVEAWSQKESVVSKLRLIKADLVVDKLVECSKHEYNLRDLLIFSKEYPNYTSLVKYRKELKKLKNDFYKELAEFYETIQS